MLLIRELACQLNVYFEFIYRYTIRKVSQVYEIYTAKRSTYCVTIKCYQEISSLSRYQ